MTSSVLWKRLSDKERKEIEEKSKKLILEFGDTLEKLPDIPETFIEMEKFEREEGSEDVSCDSDFKDLFFENAPRKNKDFIIAEKGKWTEK
ncbi:MAG: hypothetical protein QXI33_02485 [Candidatus Pacearchaeota archaeon]